jgi:hypothetical protein
MSDLPRRLVGFDFQARINRKEREAERAAAAKIDRAESRKEEWALFRSVFIALFLTFIAILLTFRELS